MSVMFECQKRADYKVLIDMLYDYVNELHEIDDSVRLRDKKTLKEEYLSNREDVIFYLMYDNDKPIGFSIIGVNSYCHPQADIYINEFYIKPEYRNKGYGKKQFMGIQARLLKPEGKVCMYILKHNDNAIRFWNNLMIRENWSNITDKYYNNTPENLYWYMYKHNVVTR